MRKRALVFLIFSATVALASEAAPNPGWEKLKTLVGTWQSTTAGHPGAVTITFKLVSNGSSLMETMDMPGHSEEMITMYAPDAPSGRIVATHYCSAGNQPRMAAAGLDGSRLDFQFLDATNVVDPNGELMRGLEIRFQDADHFEQLWTSPGQGEGWTTNSRIAEESMHKTGTGLRMGAGRPLRPPPPRRTSAASVP